jgi:hypothetical protein
MPWEGAESRDMPRARRPALHGAETSFRGKGAAVCVPTPTVAGWGFFMRAASPAVCNSPSSLHVGEEVGRGKQAVVPPAALPPSVLHALVETASHTWRRVLRVPTHHLQRARR